MKWSENGIESVNRRRMSDGRMNDDDDDERKSDDDDVKDDEGSDDHDDSSHALSRLHCHCLYHFRCVCLFSPSFSSVAPPAPPCHHPKLHRRHFHPLTVVVFLPLPHPHPRDLFVDVNDHHSIEAVHCAHPSCPHADPRPPSVHRL